MWVGEVKTDPQCTFILQQDHSWAVKQSREVSVDLGWSLCVCESEMHLTSSHSWACLACWTADGTWVWRPVELPNRLHPSWESCWSTTWWRKNLNYEQRKKEACQYSMPGYNLKGNYTKILCGQYFFSPLHSNHDLKPLIALRLPGVISQLLISCRGSWCKRPHRQWQSETLLSSYANQTLFLL